MSVVFVHCLLLRHSRYELCAEHPAQEFRAKRKQHRRKEVEALNDRPDVLFGGVDVRLHAARYLHDERSIAVSVRLGGVPAGQFFSGGARPSRNTSREAVRRLLQQLQRLHRPRGPGCPSCLCQHRCAQLSEEDESAASDEAAGPKRMLV